MVASDVKMYDDDSNTPTTCDTNTVPENLGQVSNMLCLRIELV
jgi:phospholipid-translocating ATPase